jgi:hypothetical protein
MAVAPSVQSLSGTKWNVNETSSDGHEDYYNVVFATDGTVSYTDAYGPPEHGVWKQHGNAVSIEVNDRYAERVGHFVESRLIGKGKNIKGDTWTWIGEKSSEKSVGKK